MTRTIATTTACGLGLALAACIDHKPGITGTQSIKVEIVEPADPGDVSHRLIDIPRTVRVNLTAYDHRHEIDPTFDREVQVYVQFLGTLTPSPDFTSATHSLEAAPQSLTMTAGQGVDLVVRLPPQVIGPTNLWVDDAKTPGVDPSYATGASPVLWFRDPSIRDIQQPPNETKLNALENSPLQNKQVSVNGSRHGATGRLVVTSVFAQGYTVSDMQCADDAGTPPCTAEAYDHLEVFSFSAPRDQNGKLLREGQVIDGFSGGVSEFNGLTEIGFPVTFATSDAIVPGREPVPAKLDPATWFKPLSDPQGIINFERNEAAPIEIDGGAVCDLDPDYEEFGQWKIDPAGKGGDCSRVSNLINVITTGVVSDLDRDSLVALAGARLPRVVGVLRPVVIGSFHVWIIFPRSSADLTLP